jgi:hypothetical protein
MHMHFTDHNENIEPSEFYPKSGEDHLASDGDTEVDIIGTHNIVCNEQIISCIKYYPCFFHCFT